MAPVETSEKGKDDVIILAVSHNEFKLLGKGNFVLYDVKYILNADEVDVRL